MRNKKGFSFDEEKDAKEIIATGFPGRTIDYSAMYTVAKYLRHAKHLGAIRLEKELIEFCKAQDINFNPITDAESIKKWVSSAMNYDLRKIDNVAISKNEIDFLKTIESSKDRKLLFMMLVLSKALKHRGTRHKKTDFKVSDNYYIHYNNFSDIIRLSGLKNISEVDLADILWKYKEHLTFYHAEKELIRIDFVDKQFGEGIAIDDMDKILEFYDSLFGKNRPIIQCADCGKEIIKSNNKQIYCKECAKKHILEQKREWIKNARMDVDK